MIGTLRALLSPLSIPFPFPLLVFPLLPLAVNILSIAFMGDRRRFSAANHTHSCVFRLIPVREEDLNFILDDN